MGEIFSLSRPKPVDLKNLFLTKEESISARFKNFLVVSHEEARYKVFVLNSGILVFWGNTNKLMGDLEDFSKRHDFNHKEREHYYSFRDEGADRKFKLSGEIIDLSFEDDLVVLAVSYAIALSCRATFFESKVEFFINRLMGTLTEIEKKGYLDRYESEVVKDVSMLFRDRFILNSLNDVPAFLWDLDKENKMYSAYVRVFNDLDIGRRNKSLEEKVSVLSDFYNFFTSHISSRRSNTIETFILLLIILETFVSVIHLIK